MTTLAIEAQRLGKQFSKDAWALRDCSFGIPAGSVVGLVGSNGAGKSTLLSLLAGTISRSTGIVRIAGVDPVDAQRADLAHRISYVRQERPVYGSMTALDHLEFGRRTNRYWDNRLAAAWLDTFDVPLRRFCRKLSGGERTQVTLAMALGRRPSVLLLDEPLSDLDPVVRADVTGALLSIGAERGMTIMLSTHLVTELNGVVDHIVALDAGRLLVAGDVDDLLVHHLLVTGPVDAAIPYAGVPVHVSRTERQVAALIRSTEADISTRIDNGWRTTSPTIDEIVVGYLRGAAPGSRTDRVRALLDDDDRRTA